MPELSGNGLLDRFFDWVAKGVADIADSINKEVFERPWFGRSLTPERDARSDPGWFQDHPGGSERAGMNALEQFYGSLSPAERREFFCEPSERSAEPHWFAQHFSPDAERAAQRDHAERTQTQDHGIER